MRIVVSTFVLAAGLTSAVLLTGPSVAKEPEYLLNCRLIDQNTDLWRRYCKGDKPASKIVCQGDYCIVIVKNYVGRFGGSSDVTLTIGDGPAINDGITTASISVAPSPNPGGEEPGGEEPGGEEPGGEEPEGGEPGTQSPQTSESEQGSVVRE